VRAASVALVTCAEFPDLTPDDLLLVSALARRGLKAVPALWDDPRQRWAEHAAVVLRSCWDYHRRAAEFDRWLEQLEREQARVFNPLPTLRWNTHKSYLRDLEAAGIPVVRTMWAAKGSAMTLRQVADSMGWSAMVVKPTISASAFDTWRVAREATEGSEERFARQLRDRDLMIQPYLPSIATEGELSFVFIAGAFTHAVRKRPGPGDFRVQEEHGGSAERAALAQDLVLEAARAIRVAPEPPLYARVDGATLGGRLHVTELELIEPTLYFRFEPAAAQRLATALGSAIAERA